MVTYILVGVIDQVKPIPDIYPFSDWYLYSFVNQYGDITDLKYFDESKEVKYLIHSLDDDKKTDVQNILHHVYRLISNNNPVQAKKVIGQLVKNFNLKGDISLIVKKIERFKYYKNGEFLGEENVYTWHF